MGLYTRPWALLWFYQYGKSQGAYCTELRVAVSIQPEGLYSHAFASWAYIRGRGLYYGFTNKEGVREYIVQNWEIQFLSSLKVYILMPSPRGPIYEAVGSTMGVPWYRGVPGRDSVLSEGLPVSGSCIVRGREGRHTRNIQKLLFKKLACI